MVYVGVVGEGRNHERNSAKDVPNHAKRGPTFLGKVNQLVREHRSPEKQQYVGNKQTRLDPPRDWGRKVKPSPGVDIKRKTGVTRDDGGQEICPKNPRNRLMKIFHKLLGLSNGKLGRFERCEFHGIGPGEDFLRERITAKPLSTFHSFLSVLALPG
jgi:hypothetical protein